MKDNDELMGLLEDLYHYINADDDSKGQYPNEIPILSDRISSMLRKLSAEGDVDSDYRKDSLEPNWMDDMTNDTMKDLDDLTVNESLDKIKSNFKRFL
jgi:hypothetical protein